MSSKIIAYTALHYGAIYLGAAIQSVIDAVDRYIVLYSPTPSHNGGVAQLPNPDTKERLFSIAHTVAGNKLVWIEGNNWKYENQQRGAIWDYAPDAAMILTLDADEIWQPSLLKSVMDYAFTVTNSIPPFRYMRVPFIHYWRSFNKAIVHDPAYPVRVIFPQIDEKYGTQTYGKGVINHMGYALPPEYVAYKWSGIHGHQGELRKDCDWFKDVYLANRQYDTHPVGSEWWNPETVNPWLYMPEYMKYHPYANLEVIE